MCLREKTVALRFSTKTEVLNFSRLPALALVLNFSRLQASEFQHGLTRHDFVDKKKRGGPHLFASHLAHGIPPLTVKARGRTARGWTEHHPRQPN